MATTPWRHIGVDWDSGRWVAVGYPVNGDPGVETYGTFGELWERHRASAERIIVDIPIGLCGSSNDSDDCVEDDGSRSRKCDILARKVIGPRSSSVFPAPCRAAVDAASEGGTSYSKLSNINKNHVKKGLTQQAASIIPGIRQVDAVLKNDGADETIVESHPEVCFKAFADEDLQFHKTTVQGMATRLDAMASSTEYEPGTWQYLANHLTDEAGVGVDDLIDALGLALTARANSSEFQRLPDTDSIPTDATGRPMRMVYRRPEPFTTEA